MSCRPPRAYYETLRCLCSETLRYGCAETLLCRYSETLRCSPWPPPWRTHLCVPRRHSWRRSAYCRHIHPRGQTMIAIFDYGAGNLQSVQNTLTEIGATYTLTRDAAGVRDASKIILP